MMQRVERVEVVRRQLQVERQVIASQIRRAGVKLLWYIMHTYPSGWGRMWTVTASCLFRVQGLPKRVASIP